VKDTELAALQQKTAEEITQDEPAKPAEEGLIAMLNRSPQLMGVMGGIILLLLAWLWLMLRNRRIEQDEEAAAAVAGAGAASLEEEAPQAVAGKAEDGVLSQVDAYVKQGKHAAAVETLTEALEREPDNEEYRYRLLELHYEMKNKDRARWGKVAAMGAALLPAHALFAEGAVAGESESPLGEKESPAAGGEWDDLESELEEAAGQREDEAYEFEADADDDGMVEALLEDDGQSLADEAESSKSGADGRRFRQLPPGGGDSG